MACGGSLSWASPGVYECDICTVAHREGKSIEQVRREVEQLAQSFSGLMGGCREVLRVDYGNGDRAIIHLEDDADAPRFDWPTIDERQVAWEREHAGVKLVVEAKE